MDASVSSAIGGCADALKACDQGLHISRRAVARRFLSTRTTAKVDAATTEVIESSSHRGGTNFILIWLCCFARLSLNERMKTSAITNTSRAVQTVLLLLCAGLLGLSFGGCAGTYYAETPAPESRFNTYYGPYYYPYYPWYAYYGGAYYYGVIR